MDFLRRSLAPISPEAWEQIDEEARRVLELNLAARRLVDFNGPHGWKTSSVSLGRTERIKTGPSDGVRAEARRVVPLMEMRVDFRLSLDDLYDMERGASDPDLDPVVKAAQQMAQAEDTVIFNGYKAGSVTGILPASPHKPLTISTDYTEYPRTVEQAMETLRAAGVNGPYAVGLGSRCYAGLMQATEGGYPVFERLKLVLDGPIVRAPAIDGAVVMSTRGGDFELTVGQDLSVGFSHYDNSDVHLYLIESLTYRNIAPEAAVPLRYA